MKQIPEPTTKIPVKDLAKKLICEGHLFLQSKEGRKFYLMKPGVFIDPAFIKKHAPHNTTFDYHPVINDESRGQFKQLLTELRYLRFEKDLRVKVSEILKCFNEAHARGDHFLGFALACFEEFSALSEEAVLRMHDTDVYLFRKSLYSAAFAVIIGMANDFYHHLMLKDFFNLALTLDIGLCDPGYSYYVARACNQENQKPGSGRDFMMAEKATPGELKVFLEHPARSYQFLKDNPSVLVHGELAEVTLYQHELGNGKGFPRGIPKSLVSSWESVVMLADSMVEIQDEYDFENKVMDFIVNFKNEKLKELPVGRVYVKLCEALNFFAKMEESAS